MTVLTAVSGALGPHLSGLLAPFPIITSVLAILTYAHAGVDQVVLLPRNFLLGFYGFAAFCFTLAISLPDLSTAAAFGLATATALTVQAAILVMRRRRRRSLQSIAIQPSGAPAPAPLRLDDVEPDVEGVE